jgi:hypothetical protein
MPAGITSLIVQKLYRTDWLYLLLNPGQRVIAFDVQAHLVDYDGVAADVEKLRVTVK